MAHNDPSPYVQQYRHQFEETVYQLRKDLQEIDEPQARAMMETSAEVLQGLAKAFDDYQHKTEAAWESSETKEEAGKTKPSGKVGPAKSSSPTHG